MLAQHHQASGAAIDESMGDNFRITVIATGFANEKCGLQDEAAVASTPAAEQKVVPELVVKSQPEPAFDQLRRT